MQNTDKPTSPPMEQKIPPSSSSRSGRGKRLLIAAIVALLAGLVASLLAVVLMGILRITAGVPTPMELFGDFILKHISVNNFIKLLATFSPNSKTAPLGLALLGMLGLGTVLGLLYAILVQVKWPTRNYRPGRREWLTTVGFAVVMAAIAVILFWNEIRQNFLGLPIDWSIFVTSISLLAEFALYALVLCLVYRALLPKEPVIGSEVVQSRRKLLTRAGIAALGVAAGAGTFGLVQSYLNGYASYDGMNALAHNGVTPPITPNSEHYVVTQNPVDPTSNVDVWRLEVTGLVNNPGSYTYSAIQNLPSTSRAITLECISNQSASGGGLISTAVWQGVTLSTLLSKHGGARSSASHVAFYSVDGYNISLPLNEVLAVDPLLAWRMNGSELPQRHGFPMRALIPGRYGEEQPKWLTRIELTDHFVGGLYSDQGWYHGPLHTMTRIDRPSGTIAAGSPIEVGGFSFAGNRGISKVEVSVDNGVTWNAATLAPPLSQDAWVFWTWQWAPAPSSGKYKIMARATDGTGEVQTSQRQGTVPNGATGYPIVMVEVK